eukprot:gene12814-biopygen7967
MFPPNCSHALHLLCSGQGNAGGESLSFFSTGRLPPGRSSQRFGGRGVELTSASPAPPAAAPAAAPVGNRTLARAWGGPWATFGLGVSCPPSAAVAKRPPFFGARCAGVAAAANLCGLWWDPPPSPPHLVQIPGGAGVVGGAPSKLQKKATPPRPQKLHLPGHKSYTSPATFASHKGMDYRKETGVILAAAPVVRQLTVFPEHVMSTAPAKTTD